MTRPPTTVSVGWPLWERSVIASVLGLPGYAAIGIALGFTGLGVFIDLERINGLGTIFKGCYFTGCVVSVCWVKRRALFGPMVQPPLLLAVAVPAVVLAADGGATSSGLAARLLSIGTPLLNGFPTMAVTTAFVVCIGIVRYLVQRPDPEAERVRAETVAALASQRSAERSRPAAEPPHPSDAPRRPSEQTPHAPERTRPPERRPTGQDSSEEPTSVLPTAAKGGPGPAGSGPGRSGPPGGAGPGGTPPAGTPDGGPPHPPRKSDLHRAQKRPT